MLAQACVNWPIEQTGDSDDEQTAIQAIQVLKIGSSSNINGHLISHMIACGQSFGKKGRQ